VLSLILLQGRSYADIAALLRLPDDDVRERAHAAARGLVESNAAPAPDVEAQVVDYLLGEQTVSEREQTRATLESDSVAREWAAQVVEGLSPLAKGKLPAIPDAPTEEAKPEAVDLKLAAVEPEPPADVSEPAEDAATPPADNGTATPTERGRGRRRRLTASTPSAAERPQRVRSRARVLATAIAALVIVAVIVVIVASSGGGSNKPASSSGITQLVLTPAPADAGAGGTVTVQPQNGRPAAEIRAHGLAPNTRSNSYGVWLYNTPSDALLLGFVSPPVGRSGTFENGTALPADASRFHFLIVTAETSGQPSKPGAILLRTPLRLP
jgi:hypothetical protein